MPGCNNTQGCRVKKCAKNINGPQSLQSKATFSCEVVMHSCSGKYPRESGMRSCIMPGLSTHLVQELIVGTIYMLGGQRATKELNEKSECTDK